MFNIKSFNQMTIESMRNFFLQHNRDPYNSITSYANRLDVSGLTEVQRLNIEGHIDAFNRENNPYVVIQTKVVFDNGVFVLMALTAEADGIKLHGLDFHKNSSLVDTKTLANYYRIVVNFDNFCSEISKTMDDFRADNMNNMLMPEPIRQVA